MSNILREKIRNVICKQHFLLLSTFFAPVFVHAGYTFPPEFTIIIILILATLIGLLACVIEFFTVRRVLRQSQQILIKHTVFRCFILGFIILFIIISSASVLLPVSVFSDLGIRFAVLNSIFLIFGLIFVITILFGSFVGRKIAIRSFRKSLPNNDGLSQEK